MKNKKLLGVLASSVLLVGLVGCSPTTSNPEPTDPSDPSDPSIVDPTTTSQPDQGPVIEEAVTIEFWNTKGSPYQEVIENAIESFKAVEPNVTVKNVKQSVGISSLQGVVVQGFNSNVYPDIVEGYPDHISTYIEYEKVVNLDSFISDPVIGWSEEEEADYIAQYLEEGRSYSVEGTYSLPFSKSTEILMYNSSLLNGLDLSSINPTINEGRPLNAKYFHSMNWDEFFGKLCPAILAYNDTLPASEKLLDTSLPAYGVLGYDSDDNLSITLAQQYGYPYTSIKDGQGSADFFYYEGEGENKKAVAPMIDLFDKFYGYSKNHYIITQGGLGTYTNSLIDTNGVLFLIGSTGGLSHCVSGEYVMETAIPLQPAEGTGLNKVVSQGPSICLLKHNDDASGLKQKASWLFYKHLTNLENGLAWALNGGYSPVRHSVSEDPRYLDSLDLEQITNKNSEAYLMASANLTITEYQDYMYTTPAFKGSADCRTNFGGIMEKIIGAGMNNTEYSKELLLSWIESAWNNANTAINA